MTADAMTSRGVHYTALVEELNRHGTSKLHQGERERILEAADALLFGEPGSEDTVRAAADVIEALEESDRWSAESCDQLREHLYGCDEPGRAER